jgi:hypothetical protein
MQPLQDPTHQPAHRSLEVDRPVRREPEPAANSEAERYVGFDLLLSQAFDVEPFEQRPGKGAKRNQMSNQVKQTNRRSR